jgi:hypothetical protein
MENTYECSSSLAEIQQRNERLKYRRDWLEALLDETYLEIHAIMTPEDWQIDEDEDKVVSEKEILEFINRVAQVVIEFEVQVNTPEEIENRKQQLKHYRNCFQYLLEETRRELSLMTEIIEYMSKEQSESLNQVSAN